ncbi:DNA polymerase II [Acidianus sulfidivorans JP7]|uniref:DNA polymerase n=1 Tax=Acidianus sulfidivorans JP7 TaxID=619593 RepID=A0A2U9IMH3_9CREN|nr:DNA polymerase II [Acidianus sulfidivorans]AWR97124.1 DNA polymerase II [Acidianus sulfidivorans JP7]
MIKDCYIIDFSYEVEDNKPLIYIWCIDKEGNRSLVIEENFRPYFYAILEDNANVDRIIEEIKKTSNSASPITNIESLEKKYYGNPVKVLRIQTVIPAYIRIYRDQISKIKGIKEVVEADIRFYMRYSIDKNLKPFTWFKADVEELPNNGKFRVNKVYLLKNILETYEDNPPNLKIMAFDIEVFNKYGSPNPRRDPVIIIGVWTEEGGKQFVTEDDDLKTIRQFSNFVLDYDPDIILGYNSNRFDWPYLIERTKLRNVKLDIGRKINSEPTQGTYGHYSIVGRLNVDLFGFAMGIEEVKVKSLDNIADYLGILPKSQRVNLEWYEIPEYWQDEKKRKILLQYNLDDAKSTYLLKDAFLPFGEQITAITGLPLDQLSMASVGYRVEWLLMREAFVYNEIIPNRIEREYETYKGGLVIPPKPGIHQNVYVLDFSSMYPSIMIKYNIGPDTLVKGECDDCWVAPEVGHKFRKSPDGFYKTILQKLVEERKQVKDKLKSVSDDYEKRRLDERQRALKIMANAFYGYMGWLSARWYSKEGAEAVTAWGRQTISEVAKLVESKGFEVIYGDTDSVFVKANDESKINEIVKEIIEKFGLDIKIDKMYEKIFFTENKKRYAGITKEGKIDIVGFEAIRGDWCDLAKNIQKDVIEKVLTSSVDNAVKLVRDTIMKLRRKEFNIEDLIIWKSLDKDIEDYDVDAPHVNAAKKAIKAGYAIFKGGKIGYIIVKGNTKISQRAEPYFLVKDKSRIDIDYYIDRQIVPSALRILEQFGITETTLKNSGINIMDFFNKK